MQCLSQGSEWALLPFLLADLRPPSMSLASQTIADKSLEDGSIPVATRLIRPTERVLTEEEILAKAREKADALLLGSANAGMLSGG